MHCRRPAPLLGQAGQHGRTHLRPAGETEVLEIDRGPGEQRLLVPFTRAAVPEIDVAGGRLTIDPPREVETKETET